MIGNARIASQADNAPPLTRAEKSAKRRAIVAATIGTTLEVVDLTIYAFMAVTLAKVFFPATDPTVSLLIAFASYGGTFVAKPIGAMVLGAYADRVGRRAALTISLTLMGIGSFAIALVPSYAAIGIAAPAIVILCRLLQGFSVGGEQGSVVAFVAEQKSTRRAQDMSWLVCSGGYGQIFAAGIAVSLSYLLTQAQIESWGWRVAFLIGALVYPVGIYIRRSTEETDAFEHAKKEERPVREVFTNHSLSLVSAIFLTATASTTLYTNMFLPTYAVTHLGLTATSSLATTVVSGVVVVIAAPLFGKLADRIGIVNMMLPVTVALVALSWPLFAWLAQYPSLGALAAVQMFYALLFAAYTPAETVYVAALFPTAVRASGAALTSAFGTLIAGFSPVFFVALLALMKNPAAPALHVMLMATIATCLLIVRSYRVRGEPVIQT